MNPKLRKFRPSLPTRGIQRFGYADIGRAGLGNELLAFARCVKWCCENDAQRLPSRWFQLRMGPYIRREMDKRNYHTEIGADATTLDRIHGLIRRSALVTIAEKDAVPEGSFVRTFSGLGQYFHDLSGCGDVVENEIRRSARVELCPKRVVRDEIAIHVRRGDFTQASQAAVLDGQTNTATPLEMFATAIEAIRAKRPSTRFLVFTDEPGSPDVGELVSTQCLEIAPRAKALQHIFMMASCKGLVTSNSTFSGWASFLGGHPTLWGSSASPYNIGRPVDFVYSESGLVCFAEACTDENRSAP